MQPDSEQPTDRRRFLKTTVATGIAAGVATGAAVLIPDVAMADAAKQSKPEQKPEGYRVTPHVLDYYRSAKL